MMIRSLFLRLGMDACRCVDVFRSGARWGAAFERCALAFRWWDLTLGNDIRELHVLNVRDGMVSYGLKTLCCL